MIAVHVFPSAATLSYTCGAPPIDLEALGGGQHEDHRLMQKSQARSHGCSSGTPHPRSRGPRPSVRELGADPIGVGVAEVIEDGKGPLAGGAGGFGVADGLVGIGQPSESLSFLVAIAHLLEQA